MKNSSTYYFKIHTLISVLLMGILSLNLNSAQAQCNVQNLNTGQMFCSIQAAINAPATLNGHTIAVPAGNYNESLNINKSLTLQGAQKGSCAPARAGAESVIICTTGITINASNVTIDGFTITGQTDTTAAGYGFAINMMPPNNGTRIINNIIRNNSAGCSLTNSGALPPLCLISCNWFDNNNVPGPFASEGVFSNEDVSGGPVTNVAITLNKFSSHADAGINFFNLTAGNTTSGVTITSNEFDGNGRAAFLSRVNNCNFSQNFCHNSTLATSADLRLFGSVTNLIASNNSFVESGNDVHAVRISGGQGLNSNVLLNNNSFVGYAADTAVWILAGGYSGTLNAHCNWWNTTSNLAIAAQVVGAVDYMPWLSNGTDNSPAIGFQPVPNSCNGCPGGLITNINTGLQYCSFQAANDDPATLNGHTISAAAGTYNESFNITKTLKIQGVQAGNCAPTRSGPESIINCVSGIGVSANDVYINGFTIQGQTADSTGPGFGAAIRMNAPFNGTHILNNIIKNNMKGVTVSNTGNLPAQVLINCNWFDSNNNLSPDSTSITPSGHGVFSDETVSGGPVTQVTINRNKFSNHNDAGVTFFNRIPSNVTSGMLIADNEFDGNGRATFLSRVNNTSFQSNYCHNSTLATSADVRLFGGVTNFIASNNSFVYGGNDVHVLRLSNGQGANTNVLVNENSFVGYAADTAIWIIGAGYTGTLNAHCNWWNTTSNAAIAAQVVGAVDYMPWLSNGTDNSPAIGFQPVPNSCNGCPGGLITNVNTGKVYCTFQAAIDDPATLNGHTISAPAGTYNESFNITKTLKIEGAQANNCAVTRAGAESIINCVSGIGVSASNVYINGFTIQGQTADSTGPGFGAAIRMNAPFNGTHILNNIIKNNMKGVTVSNAGNLPAGVLINCNWFDSNNNLSTDSTSITPSGHGVFSDETVSGGPVTQVTINRNKFSNHNDAGVTFFNRVPSNVTSGMLIADNEFDGNGRATFLSRVNNTSFQSNYCHNSTLATSADVRLFGGVTNFIASNNSFVYGGNDVHVLRLSNGQGANTNVLVNENSFVGYAADTAIWIIGAGYTGTLNAHCNWWNTTSNAAIAAQVVGAVDYMPWLSNGTDNSPAIGFQPVPNSCNGCPGGLITNINTGLQYCTFQAAIDDPATLNGHTISAPAGTYNESFNITKTLKIQGVQAGNCAPTRSGPESIINCVSGIGVSANNVYINGFTIQGQTADSTGPGFGAAIRMNAPFNGTQILNNIIKNNMKGVTVSNAGNLPAGVLINCNWFDSNNNLSADSTSITPSGHGVFSDETVSGGPVTQVTINRNKFSNHNDAGVTFFNRIPSNVTSGMLIADNEFDGNGRATFLSRVNNTSFQSNYCHNSTLATSADVRLFGGVTNFIASNNSFVYGGNDVHVLRLSNGQGANTNVLVNENSFVGYAADTAIWIFGAGYTGTLNAHCNWWNTTSNAAIAAQVVGAVDYMPWLSNGTDNSPAIGFQPVPNSCNGCPGGLITNVNTGKVYCTFQAANDDPATLNGHTISAPAGTYNESFNITKTLKIEGAQANNCAVTRAGAESIINCVSGIGVSASNVYINGFTIQGQTADSTGPGFGAAIRMNAPFNGTHILNNIIKNNMKGVTVSNAGNLPAQVLINCNWFDSNNNLSTDSTSITPSGHGVFSDETVSGGPVTQVTINRNKFSNHNDAGVTFFNRVPSNVTSGMLIADNEFDGNGRATFLSRVNNTSFQSNYCHNSTLATSADIRLFGGVTNFIASNNTFIESNNVHAVRLSGGQGVNSNVLINENSFVGYAADTAVWILAGGYSGTLNAHCNWWNTTSQPAIAAQTAGPVDYNPWLTNGTDNSPVIGFQPIPNSCNGYPAPALTVTLNGHTLTGNNDGNDETVSMVVCNVSNNMTFSAISDVNNTIPQSQIKVRQEFVATNSTVCCPDGDLPISSYGGTFQHSANLVTTGISGKLIIKLHIYNDLNNNNTLDTGEPAGDWLIFTVNIDGKAPTLTVPADVTVECNQIPPVGIASVTDDFDQNPTVQYLGETRTPGNCPGNFTLTRTWKATDACGNSSTKSQTITVQDHTPPTITCPAAIIVRCAGNVPQPAPTTVIASDNCSGVTVSWVTDVITGQTCANRYTITRIYLAIDACGNSATCTQTITVFDNVAPTIICPQPVTVKCAGSVPQPSTTAVQAFDDCPGAVTVTWLSDVISNQTCANRYTITRTYRATDVCGNSATCTQTITVFDDVPPTITCPQPIFVSCASAVPAPTPSTIQASDNCGSVTVTWVSDRDSARICANRVIIIRTYKATDACGNSATCTQTITVNDNTAPVITCPQSITVKCASAVPAPSPASVTASDNCGSVTVTWVSDRDTARTCANRFMIIRTYRATDACGNSATCTQTITVFDDVPPTITCPQALTVQCASAVPAPTPSTVAVSDNCSGNVTVVWVSDVESNRTCANRFTITRTYRATDACGNSATCTQIITVNDNTGPTFTRPADKAIPFINNCSYDASVNNTGSSTNISDNCGGNVVMTFSDVVQQCGSNIIITRTWKATDVCGNFSQQVQTITVTDNNTSYIIYAKTETKFGEANSIGGDVGVTDANGTADFKKNDVLDPYTVRAKNITVQLPATVNNKVFSPAVGGPNPAFMTYVANPLSGTYNQAVNGVVPAGNYKNLTIKKGITATVNGSDYGTVTIEENANVTFTSSNINMEELQVKKGKDPNTTNVYFTQCAALKVRDKVTVEANCRINVSGPKVNVYMGLGGNTNADFVVNGDNVQITANIMIPKGTLNVGGGAVNTLMTGWYIIEKLASGKNVIWNRYGCGSIASRPAEPVFTLTKPVPVESFDVKVYPNPSSTDFSLQVMSSSNEPISIRIIDANGTVLKVNPVALKGSLFRFGTDLISGTYFAEVRQGANRQVVKLIKLN